MKKPSGSVWNEVIQYMYHTDDGINPCKEIRLANVSAGCGLSEPIQELNNMSHYYNTTNQSQAETAISNSHYVIGYVDTYGHFSFSNQPAIHKHIGTANIEAKRLAGAAPGKTFVVVQLIAGFRASGILEF